MYTDVKIICKALKRDLFTGHLKLGIEHGNVTSMQRNFYKCVQTVQYPKGRDYDVQLKELEGRLNFGNLEYDFEFGEIVNMTASDYLNAKELKEWINANKTRGIKIVVVKSAGL